MAEVLGKADLHPLAGRGRLGLGEAVPQSFLYARSDDHGIEKINKGRPVDEVSGADQLDISDGLHQGLGRGPG